MNKNTFTQRIRQLLAADTNAENVYKALAQKARDPSLKETFAKIALDEMRHVKMSVRILSELEEKEGPQ